MSFTPATSSRMASNPQSAAIHTLNDDVLQHIFEFNGDMFACSGALETTRMTSQVCQPWRDLILETPSLWAKLVDMDAIYDLRNRNWQNELIRRGGDAPLWIKAEYIRDDEFFDYDEDSELPPCDNNIEQFFEDVVTDNWHRIEKLILSHKSAFRLTNFTLSFPAPLLVHIEAAVPEPSWLNTAKTGPIFAN